MKHWIVLSTTVLGIALTVAPASSQQPSRSAVDCKNTPATVEGQVTNVDPASGRVTLRGTDGKTHEFQASREVAQTMKKGDKLEARLRDGSKC